MGCAQAKPTSQRKIPNNEIKRSNTNEMIKIKK